MAGRKGLNWKLGPEALDAQITARRDELSGQVESEMERLLKEAVAEMERIGYTGGVLNHRPTGAPRARTFDMLKSIDYILSYAKGSGRVLGKFGYLNGPDYTKYQEYGTVNADGSERIKELLAFAQAYQTFRDNAEETFGRLDETF